ncbi:putative monooxygenase [Moniliophthora roreri]|uniref:Uncharacterized protein n=1 Tax=Moniliophthora roreri TaxID=221103 RepID=A0A0W0FWW6_MONRR|nr:putative monooxygenase [Moniliophthora roreri]
MAKLPGLILALLLLRHDIPVQIIDKGPTFMVGQRGAGIMPRTQELYKILGILPQVEKGSARVPKVRMYPSPEVEGQPPLKEYDMVEHFEEKPEYYHINAVMFGQEDHQAMLREILSKEYGCHIELSTELVSFTPHPDHVVARIRNLKTFAEEKVCVDWLLGADGAHSVVRKQLGLTFLGETVDAVTLAIGDIEVLEGFDSEFWSMWGSHTDRMVTLRPYSRQGKNYHWFGVGGKNIDVPKVASDREMLLQHIHEIIGRKKFKYGEVRSAAPWKVNIRMTDRFGQGRVFVAGDAAHIHSPTGGQGLNSGVQDSFNLAWKLALVHKGLAAPSLLESYTTEHLPVIASMLNQTTELMHKSFVSVAGDHRGWIRGWDLRQFGVNYHGSLVILDERYTDTNEPVDPYRSSHDGTAHAGDRASDAPGLVWNGEKKRLFDLLDSVSHTALFFCGEQPSTEAKGTLDFLSVHPRARGVPMKTIVIYPQGNDSPKDLGMDYTFVDGDAYAYKHYCVKQGESWIVIVRPDGYIGAVVKGASGLQKYFQLVLQ